MFQEILLKVVHLLFGATAPFSIIFSNVFITLLFFFLDFFQCYLKKRKGCHDLKKKCYSCHRMWLFYSTSTISVIYPSLVLVQPRKTRPYITERLLMGR